VAPLKDNHENANYPDLETVLNRYLTEQGRVDIMGACIAVAGPVRNGVATMTNLGWTIDKRVLSRAVGSENVSIVNDLQAQGHALGRLDAKSLRPITKSTPQALNATRLVIGIGTGFNCAPVFETQAGRFVPPAEAGHMTIPAFSCNDSDLMQFVETADGVLAVDDVLSGRGLEHIHRCLSAHNGMPSELSAAEIMAEVSGGLNESVEASMLLFVRILGIVIGDLALIHLPFGGIYLVGGVANAVAPYLERFKFRNSMADKGRFAEFMTSFSVTVIEDDYAALIGCAYHLADQKKARSATLSR
jgi:glucokinase